MNENVQRLDDQDIKDQFELFGIDLDKLPEYSNARDFALQFKRCSIITMDEVICSDVSNAQITLTPLTV
jgi:hypothetical protein